MLPWRLRVRLILYQFLSWFQSKKKFAVGDIVAPKFDPWQGIVREPVYLKVMKIEKDTIFTTRGQGAGLIYFDPKDLIKVELTDLEKTIYGL